MATRLSLFAGVDGTYSLSHVPQADGVDDKEIGIWGQPFWVHILYENGASHNYRLVVCIFSMVKVLTRLIMIHLMLLCSFLLPLVQVLMPWRKWF